MIAIKEGLAGESLGLDMYEAHRDGEELPEIDLELPQDLEKLEELIKLMTSFQPQSRPSSLHIQEELCTFVSEVICTRNYYIYVLRSGIVQSLPLLISSNH